MLTDASGWPGVDICGDSRRVSDDLTGPGSMCLPIDSVIPAASVVTGVYICGMLLELSCIAADEHVGFTSDKRYLNFTRDEHRSV